MNAKMTAIALAVTLGLAAGAAQAAVDNTQINSNWSGSNTAGWDSGFISGSKTSSFSDYFTFSIPSGAGTSGGASAISGYTKFFTTNVNISEFELEDVTGMSTAQIQSDSENVVANGSTGSTAFLSFSDLNPTHTYALELEGTLANNATHGSYSGNVSIDPVPEASEWAMMASGLGLFGFIASRRNKKAA